MLAVHDLSHEDPIDILLNVSANDNLEAGEQRRQQAPSWMYQMNTTTMLMMKLRNSLNE